MNVGWMTLSIILPGFVVIICLLASRLRRCQRRRAELEELSRALLRAQEQERQRISTEIHDGLSQNLLIIRGRAGLALAAGSEPNSMQEQLQEICKVCQVAIEEARHIAHNLGPSHLETTGLTEALEVMIDRVANSTQMQFTRKLEMVDELFSSESAINLYRITQEALNNVLKHSKASLVRVDLIRDIRHVELRVEDNGQGIAAHGRTEPTDGYKRGFGLAGISERVEMLRGALVVESQPGKGTSLIVTIPINDAGKA